MTDAAIRLAVYEHFAATGDAPAPPELARRFGLPPVAVEAALVRLERDADALVLLPGSPYIWMAEPFSAVPTSFAVRSGERRWWGNCAWDALAIPSLLGVHGTVDTACPDCGAALTDHDDPVAHFAVPARDWWRSIGFT